MKKTSLKKRSFVILLILFCYILSYNGIKTDFISALTPHASISITSDAGFSIYGFPGTGEFVNPYVIDSYNITTTDDRGIEISGTTKHFLISNCYIDAVNYGVYISNIADGTATITNNTCENNVCGIDLYYSNINTLNGNNCTNNSYGILLAHSNNNTLNGNNCTNNNSGIYLSFSSNNTLDENNCTSNNNFGIVFSHSNNNTVSENNCSNNIRGIEFSSSSHNILNENNCTNNNSGIYIEFSINNTVSENKCNYNSYAGINLESSSNNSLSKNDCTNNGYGILLAHSNNNTASENNCTYNSYGIFLSHSTNTLNGNNCTNNNHDGIRLYNANNNTINANNCTNNNNNGIDLSHSNYNTVSKNNCTNNNYAGIRLDSSNNNTLNANNCTNNNNNGIYLCYSNNNTINANNCTNNNNNGIYLFYSNYNTVSENNFTNSDNFGICLYSSNNNTLSKNNCTNNNSYGIYLYLASNNNTVSKNNCSSNNWDGIFIYQSNYTVITENFLQDNINYGIYINSLSFNNLIYGNTFDHNRFGGTSQGYDDGTGNQWDNQSISEGNFWSDLTGSDYFIDGSANAVDHYPFEYPLAAPVIENITHSPSTPTNFDIITISATIIDPSGIESSTLHYRINEGSWITLSMTHSTGSTYQTTIGIFTVYTIISYYITAVDNSSHHHEAIEDNNGLYYQFTVAQGDITPPSITDVSQEPSTPNDLEIITISATVGDSSGIDSVTLHYRINGGSWYTVSMTLSTGSTYQATIGPFTMGSTIEYYITAIDSAPNHNQAIDNNNGLYYQFSISPSDFTEPTITDVSHDPSAPTDLETITISATVSDSSGIDSVTLHYRINDGPWSMISMTLSTGSTYQVTIGPFNDADNIEYYITAVDNSTNNNQATNDNSGLFYSFTVLNIISEYTLNTMMTTIFAISLLFISYSIRRKN